MYTSWRSSNVTGNCCRFRLGGNESYPDLFQPYGGFPDGVKVENSIVTLPELNGIGFEGKSDLFAVMKEMTS